MDNHDRHLDFHSKMLDDPELAPLFGYWKFETFWQKLSYWLKTGTWPKKEWVNGLTATLNHISEHKMTWLDE